MLITVDTGGTKTLVASFKADGELGRSIKFPTPRDQAEYIQTLVGNIEELAEGETIDALVIALPGVIENGVALWCKNLGWTNFDAQDALEPHFPGVGILIENDANLAGLAAARMLDDTPTSVLYITLSTGIGSGIITEGKIDHGLRKSEVGHALVEYNGEVREWESFAAGSSVYRDYGKYARDIDDPEVWQEISYRISRGFLAIIPTIQPDIILFGGSMGTHFDKYAQPLEEILRRDLPEHIPCPPLQAANYPEEAVIYGCYYYALDELATVPA